MRIPDGDSLSLSSSFTVIMAFLVSLCTWSRLWYFLSFFLFFFLWRKRKNQKQKAAGLNAMLELRIVNTKPCNLQNAFVIFTSNFSFSTEWVPHMKRGNQKRSCGMRWAKNERKDEWQSLRPPALLYVSSLLVSQDNNNQFTSVYIRFASGDILICSRQYKIISLHVSIWNMLTE